VLDDSLAAIRRQYDVRTVRFEPIDANADVAAVRLLPFVQRLERSGDEYEALLAERTEPGAAIRSITATVPVARIELARPRLEDIFVAIVAGADPLASSNGQLKAALRGESAGAGA
jgi:ABC-type uncharacterized transport system ATPase subunit